MRFFKYSAVALLAAGSVFACAAEGDSDGGEGGASNASGGTGSGSGGAPGASGGAPGASGGAPGASGGETGASGGAPGSCTAAGTTDPVIADFEGVTDPVIKEVDGRKGLFVTTPASSNPETTVAGGVLTVKTDGGPWATTGTVIADAQCYNATSASYTGIKFTISSPSNAKIKFALTTPETSGTDAGGTCTDGCSDHPAKIIDVTAAPTEHCLPFSSLATGNWGTQPLPNPENHILGLAWGALEQDDALDISLDNVAFVTSCP